MLPEELLELVAAGFDADELDAEVGGEDDEAEEDVEFEEVRDVSLDVELEPSRRSPRRESPPSPRLSPRLERPRSPSPNRRQRSRRSSRFSLPAGG